MKTLMVTSEDGFGEDVQGVNKIHDDVSDAVAVGVPGESFDIIVVVEPRTQVELDEAAIIGQAKGGLVTYERPKRLLGFETVGRAPTGKTDDSGLKREPPVDEVARTAKIACP